MDVKRHKELLGKILENLGNQALVSNLLSELEEDNATIEGTLKTHTKTIDQLNEYNADLKKENNRLFTNQKAEDEEDKKKDKEKNDEEDENEGSGEDEDTTTFDDLFNEKGELI